MPFVQRVVTPIYISRAKKTSPAHHTTTTTSNGISAAVAVDAASASATTSPSHRGGAGGGSEVVSTALALPASDYEFEAVTNLTLSNALRQLASLVLIANDIFNELHGELQAVGERARGIKGRVERLGRTVEEFDPKLVAVRKLKAKLN